MKFLHVSDIHLGKRLHGASLLEDHEHILSQILALAQRPDCDAVIIAGDVYNRAQPLPDSISQFSRFLTCLAELGKPVFIARGNHDGEAQLAYAAPLLSGSGIHISRIFDGAPDRITLRDAYGDLHIWLLPFIKPVQARRCFPEADVSNYADAVKAAVSAMPLDPTARNILVTHQYVFGAETSESEERVLAVGGLDQVPASVFSAFDYVALGHLHKAQTLDGGRIRYSGAPLVYAFDEVSQNKSATMVTIGEKGTPNEFEFIPFEPLHPCRRLEGTLEELAAQPRSDDYVQIVLTDKTRPLDPMGTLRVTWPKLLNLLYANRPDESAPIELPQMQAVSDPLEHFAEFFTFQNDEPPTQEQLDVVREILQEGGWNA